MSWTFCLSGAATSRAGVNATNPSNISGAIIDAWSEQAEGRIIAECRRDFITDYAAVPAGVSGALAAAESSMVAMNIINFDMSGYTSKREAETMLDVNFDTYRNAIKILRDFKSTTIKSVD